jgi:hypothetical protein
MIAAVLDAQDEDVVELCYPLVEFTDKFYDLDLEVQLNVADFGRLDSILLVLT